MPNAVGLIKTIKRVAVEAIKAEKPVEVCFGVVKSVDPLKIFVDQKMILGESQIILSRNVTNFSATVTGDCLAESGGAITTYATSFVGKIPYYLGAGRNHNTLEEIVAAVGMSDCSAFTERVFRHFGAEIGSTCAVQQNAGIGVDLSDVQDGDLLLFDNHLGGAQPGHVGIYMNGGKVVHEGGGNYTGNVKISQLSAFTVMYVRRITESEGGSSGGVITGHYGLAVGDELILLRKQGGQKYIVMDRLG